MNKKDQIWFWAGWISRVLVGLVFVFSGFVKAVDPLGSTYKFSDYFLAYNLGFLEPGALFFSILLSAAELSIGLALVLSIRIRQASWGALLFMALFLPLTLISALTNKVTDCGCFGDALTLSNWETFWKNVVLMLPVLIAFFTRRKAESRLPLLMDWSIMVLLAVLSVGISITALRHLPLLDFRPYRTGTNIAEGMRIPEGAPQDEYAISAVYKKGEVVQEFQYPDFPDSTWTWVETKNVLIKKGYEPPIHGFSLSSTDGRNLTDSILNNPGFTFFVVYHDLDKADMSGQKEINDLADFAVARGLGFYGLTGSGTEIIENFEKSAETHFPFLQVDEITLKTMVRSNPGLILMKEGTILGMWSVRDIPKVDQIKDRNLMAFSLEQMENAREKWVWLSSGLVLLVLAGGIFSLKGSCRKPQ